jgi:hypothetical protein
MVDALTVVCDVQVLGLSPHPLPLSNLFLNAPFASLHSSFSYLPLLSFSLPLTHAQAYASKRPLSRLPPCKPSTYLSISILLKIVKPSPFYSLRTSIATIAPMVQTCHKTQSTTLQSVLKRRIDNIKGEGEEYTSCDGLRQYNKTQANSERKQ